MSHAETLRSFIGAFVDALAAAGVREAVICPGSRSTPLALLLRRHPRIRTWVLLDERSAAFFALGLAKAERNPVAVVATSGTATANFFPAVIEAYYGRAPLLVLTADRPPELREVGALQTIDQVRLYGGQVKWFQELLLPEPGPRAARQARMVAARAVALAKGDRPGPVHINVPVREPLLPAPGLPPAAPAPTIIEGDRVLPPGAIADLAASLARARRGVIVCGPQDDPAFPAAAARLGAALRWPVLADVLSQLRGSECGADTVLAAYDLFLREPAVTQALAADCIVRFGATPVSKALQSYLEQSTARQVVIDPGGWPDPAVTATDIIWASPTALCAALAEQVGASAADPGWLVRWQALETEARRAFEEALAAERALSEPAVFAALAHALPAGATLVLGNSMPIRDAETVLPVLGRRVRMLANRGASGIDGVVSTALGVAALRQPVVLVLGDLSFYHDLNGLLAAKRYRLSATIIVINNDGGGIFSFLPQAEQADHFEELFGTPHGLDFTPAADLYGLTYRRVEGADHLRGLVAASLEAPGVTVLEVRTRRDENVAVHRRLMAAVSAALRGVELRSP
ncbi:MAG: 2-succinyl-5-enolpyruvyl-6-hydroxy-3-cyclohexene-1-carboxylic-acid synthase [Chloroflexota bacterium]|nr:2-succinyl-5-enolpyruvyl-6-hydroxy-3-cyclohexene-1-carboxylic-acid synthase [Dehalococcoidia bacterium]MDW8254028.1 2-succinyl-5-enolpyruvyl-6-hydroxy-3-cyclohexene-1-carboxylic-acid synthase [Chloroflexota bacterium]